MLILFKNIVLVMFIWMCLYTCACVSAGAHRDQEGLRSPVTGAIGDCELSDMHAGAKLRSSARALHSLNP